MLDVRTAFGRIFYLLLVLSMPITRSKKEEIVAGLMDQIKGAKALAFAKFHGLSVGKTSEARRKFRAGGGSYTVAKKSLIALAFKKAGLGDMPALEGEIALISGDEDELSIYKTASDLAKKEKEAFQLVGGFFEGNFIGAETAKALGAIPSREALIAQLMSVIIGNTRKFVYLVDQIQKQKSQ